MSGRGRREPARACRRQLGWVAVLALLTLAGGCGWPGSAPAASQGDEQWPPSVPEVEVDMYDYGFRFDTSVPAGRVIFRVRNTGSVPHRVTLVPLPEDVPPIEEQVAGDERRTVNPLGATNRRAPGTGSAFAVDLEKGRRYALICYEKDDEGVVHARKGGAAEFRAGGPSTAPPEKSGG